jgi:CIC family chloride channel protein
LKGVVTRAEIESALVQRRQPVIEPAIVCYDDDKLRNIENKFIQSTTGMVIVLSKKDSSMGGLITLHDLLRAQAAMME